MDDMRHMCWYHMAEEPWDPDEDFMVCGECFHVYDTAAALEDQFKAALGYHRPAAEIFACPHCAHDF